MAGGGRGFSPPPPHPYPPMKSVETGKLSWYFIAHLGLDSWNIILFTSSLAYYNVIVELLDIWGNFPQKKSNILTVDYSLHQKMYMYITFRRMIEERRFLYFLLLIFLFLFRFFLYYYYFLLPALRKWQFPPSYSHMRRPRLRSCLFCEGRISVLKRWFKNADPKRR